MKVKTRETRWQWIKRNKYKVFSLALLILVCFLAGTVFAGYLKEQNEQVVVIPTPTQTPITYPTQTPKWTPPWIPSQPTPTVCCGQNGSPMPTLAPWEPWFPTPTPSSTAPMPFPTGHSQPGMLCDIDVNGYANDNDIRKMLTYVLGAYEPTPIGLMNTDVNGDGKVDFTDIRWCFYYTINGY